MKESMGSSKPAKIKVSQATIDKIKKVGMTKALAGAKSANPEMKEALTRMYGARRVAAATNASAPKQTPRNAMVDMGGAKKKAVANRTRTGTPAGPAKPKMPGKGPAANMAKKKSGTTDPFAKFVFGVGRAAAEPFKSKPKK
jgi:hypothetical protein